MLFEEGGKGDISAKAPMAFIVQFPTRKISPKKKIKILGTRNFGAYARKMLIYGYIIKVDYSEQRKLAAEVNKIGININQICKRINETGRAFAADISELKSRMEDIWRLLKSSL